MKRPGLKHPVVMAFFVLIVGVMLMAPASPTFAL